MWRTFMAAACAGAALMAPPALAEQRRAAQPAAYEVLEADARIPFRSQINGFRPVEDAVLLRVGVNHWYRAGLEPTCARDLRFAESLPLVDRGRTGVDKFSHIIVNGRPCYFDSFDRIADPDAPAAEPAQ